MVAGWFYIIFFKTFSFQFDPSKDFAVFARIMYDAENERLNIVEEVDVKKERTFYEYILLYPEVNYNELSTQLGSCFTHVQASHN